MGTGQVQSLDQADETRSFPNGVVEMVTIGDTMLGRAWFEPGWRWSNDVKVHGPNPQPGRPIWNLETPDVHGDFQRLSPIPS
jgi:hypothetical protein